VGIGRSHRRQAAQQARQVGCGGRRRGLHFGQQHEFGGIGRAAAHEQRIPLALGLVARRQRGRIAQAVHCAIGRSRGRGAVQCGGDAGEGFHGAGFGLGARACGRLALRGSSVTGGQRSAPREQGVMAAHAVVRMQRRALFEPRQCGVGEELPECLNQRRIDDAIGGQRLCECGPKIAPRLRRGERVQVRQPFARGARRHVPQLAGMGDRVHRGAHRARVVRRLGGKAHVGVDRVVLRAQHLCLEVGFAAFRCEGLADQRVQGGGEEIAQPVGGRAIRGSRFTPRLERERDRRFGAGCACRGGIDRQRRHAVAPRGVAQCGGEQGGGEGQVSGHRREA